MSKYKPGDKFILEITEMDQEAFLRGYPHPTYLIKGMDGAFSENVLDKLECIEPQTAFTNADNIRNMSIEELAAVIMCPYDTAGDPEDIMPCAKDGIQEMVSVEACRACCIAWLNRKAEVSDGKSNQ